MTDDPIDFTALDPSRDRERLEANLRAIHGAAAGELARRRAAGSVWADLARWRRPTLAAAAVLAMLTVGTLLSVGRPSSGGLALGPDPAESDQVETALAEAIGVPDALAPWVGGAGDRSGDGGDAGEGEERGAEDAALPTIGELLVALGEG